MAERLADHRDNPMNLRLSAAASFNRHTISAFEAEGRRDLHQGSDASRELAASASRVEAARVDPAASIVADSQRPFLPVAPIPRYLPVTASRKAAIS
jgi:hypothetical protein